MTDQQGDTPRLIPDAVYISLFHGRDTVEEEMEDRGYQGPIIGPFRYVQITYMSDIKFAMEKEAFKAAFPDIYQSWVSAGYSNAAGDYDVSTGVTWIEHSIQPVEDCFPWQGKFYGDFSIISSPER